MWQLPELPAWCPSWMRVIFRKPELNFKTIHYIFILALAFLGSIMVYPVKNMRYIDALFFASGSATQSGLNTIDINKITTYQQVVLLLIPWLSNPITINTAVVFVRLYWFEKRFKDIVEETKSKLSDRRTISRDKHANEPSRIERGVGNRSITVLHSTRMRLVDGPEGMHMVPTNNNPPPSPSTKSFMNNGSTDPKTPHQDITQLKSIREDATKSQRQSLEHGESSSSSSEDEKDRPKLNGIGPGGQNQTPVNQHIAFVETQRERARQDTGALHVPSPREFERGGKIRSSDVGDNDNENTGHENDIANDSHMVNRSVTIEEPSMTTHTANSRLRMRHITSKGTSNSMQPSKSMASTFNKRSTTHMSDKTAQTMPYLSYTPTIGRNSAFVNLTDEQRNELGGIEYRSLRLLASILVGYFVFFQIFGVICLTPWILHATYWRDIVVADGQSPTWWGIFTASSAFTDLGFTLTPDSMSSFNTATWPILIMIFLIVIGNTGFPCMLRFVIWAMWKVCPDSSPHKESLHFLLDHPRRCFTLLFPSKATWVLFGILVGLNAVDVILFIVLDLNDDTVTSIPVGYRILDAFFQAASTRTAGFGIINLAALHPAVQVSYLVMMYISVFPIAISVRRTNVYEESSLGVYATKDEEAEDEKEPSFVAAHLRRQLSYDLWYVFLGLFAICIAEASKIENRNDFAFTQFSILFEVVSSYGTVGLSLGYPDVNTSFSGQFTTFSKLVIISMMIRGRHRGLPYGLDRAIRLPSEKENVKEEEDAKKRINRRFSTFSLNQENQSLDGPFRPSIRSNSVA